MVQLLEGIEGRAGREVGKGAERSRKLATSMRNLNRGSCMVGIPSFGEYEERGIGTKKSWSLVRSHERLRDAIYELKSLDRASLYEHV